MKEELFSAKVQRWPILSCLLLYFLAVFFRIFDVFYLKIDEAFKKFIKRN